MTSALFGLWLLVAPTVDQPKPISPPPETSAAEVAKRVQEQYETRDSLSFVAIVNSFYPTPTTIRAEVNQTGGDNVDLVVYEEPEIFPIFQFRVREVGNGQVEITEANARLPSPLLAERTYRLDKTAFYHYATWDPRLVNLVNNEVNACRFAAYFQSWIGPGSERLVTFIQSITPGLVMGEVEVGGRCCWQVSSGGTNGRMEEIISVDKTTGLIMGWDKVEVANGEAVRERRFFYPDLDNPLGEHSDEKVSNVGAVATNSHGGGDGQSGSQLAKPAGH